MTEYLFIYLFYIKEKHERRTRKLIIFNQMSFHRRISLIKTMDIVISSLFYFVPVKDRYFVFSTLLENIGPRLIGHQRADKICVLNH